MTATEQLSCVHCTRLKAKLQAFVPESNKNFVLSERCEMLVSGERKIDTNISKIRNASRLSQAEKYLLSGVDSNNLRGLNK